MNGFERHGIRNLSASQCNSFVAEPAKYLWEKLRKIYTPAGTVAARGKAVEAGVAHGLLHPDADPAACQEIGLAAFDKEAALSGDPRREHHRASVAPTIAVALAELRQYGVPDLVQTKIEVTLPDIPVPFWGYIDFGWTEHGIIVDLKTGDKVPGEISRSHARAGALYIHGTNRQMRFAYASPKKVHVYPLEDVAYHTEAIRQIALRMERFFSLSDDPDFLISLLAPDYDDFRWNDPASRARAKEVFGF